jgi:hypothetical protein
MEDWKCPKCRFIQYMRGDGKKIICIHCGHVEITLTVQDGISGQNSEIKGEDHGKI